MRDAVPDRPRPVRADWPDWPRFRNNATQASARELMLEFTPNGSSAVEPDLYANVCKGWAAYKAKGLKQQERYNSFGYAC